MTDSSRHLSRRRTLQLTGGVLAGVGVSGTASAGGASTDDAVRANVGYDTADARDAALSVASVLHFEFSFDALTVTAPPGELRDLAGREDVRYVERDQPVEAVAHDSQVRWGVDRVDAEAVHGDGSNTGNGADVAIIDTGIDRTHPDLQPNLEGGARVIGVPEPTNFNDGNTQELSAPAGWQDDNSHGTHVAGTVAAAANDPLGDAGVVGVAPDANLHAVKALNASGQGLTSNVAAGINYVADQGWDIANLSLGASGPTEVLRDAVKAADEAGVLLVAAAGNSGSDGVDFPAGFEEVMAVGATNEGDSVPDFSSRGKQVDIAAPGVDIYSTVPGGTYASFDGTSFAAPHVAGAAALLVADGTSSPRSALTGSAEDIEESSDAAGAGLLDVAAAVGVDSGDDTFKDSVDDHSSGVFGSGFGPSLL